MGGGRMTTYIPTEREMQVLRAYLDAGTCKQAAELLEVSEQAIKQTLWRMRAKSGVAATTQLLFALHKELARMGPIR